MNRQFSEICVCEDAHTGCNAMQFSGFWFFFFDRVRFALHPHTACSAYKHQRKSAPFDNRDDWIVNCREQTRSSLRSRKSWSIFFFNERSRAYLCGSIFGIVERNNEKKGSQTSSPAVVCLCREWRDRFKRWCGPKTEKKTTLKNNKIMVLMEWKLILSTASAGIKIIFLSSSSIQFHIYSILRFSLSCLLSVASSLLFWNN